MKISIYAFALIALSSASLCAENSFYELTKILPRYYNLLEYVKVVKYPETAKNEKHLTKAKEVVEKAKPILQKMRSLIKPETSVFEYKGLLQHGSVRYEEYSNSYSMIVGFYFLPHEGTGKYQFRITFNEQGIISKISDVTHRR
jgi:hypothetical protein